MSAVATLLLFSLSMVLASTKQHIKAATNQASDAAPSVFLKT
jgi:hypothetical protein